MTPDVLRSLPSSWQLKPLRAVADYLVSNVDKVPAAGETPVRLCNYTDVYNNEWITPDLDLMASTATIEEIEKFSLAVGDVVITKDSESWDDIGVPALIRQTEPGLVCGYHLAILRPHRDAIDGEYLLRCLQAKSVRLQLELSANGVTRFGIPKSAIGRLKVPVPPLETQQAIASYLNEEAFRLDSLAEAKKRLLLLLSEKRRVLIAEILIEGLDCNRNLRDSGVDWLGRIPEHWETRRLAWLFRERDQRGEPKLPLLEVSINTGVVLREFSDERIESTAADFNTYKVARSGDVVFNKMRMWQGAVGIAPEDGLVSPDYVVAEPTGGLSSGYAGLLFRTPAFSAECARYSHGLVWDRLRLYWEGFREIEVPVPPIEEQRAMVAFIREATGRIDKLKGATDRTIELLKERRAVLISDAVTGRIDVEAG